MTYLSASLKTMAASLVAAAIPALSSAQDNKAIQINPTLAKALKESRVIADARIRFENADFGTFDQNANAITFRLRLGAESGEFFGTKFLVEFDYIESLLDDFNSTRNGEIEFPIVADPEAIELNRIQITNTSLPDTTATIGRQRIVLDDSRFVGNVGFRQNEQTYDAFRFVNNSFGDLTLDFTYSRRANRIFGDDPPFDGNDEGPFASDFEGDSFFIRAAHPTPVGNLVTFAYLVDIEELGDTQSTQTYGFRLTDKRKIGSGNLSYAVSYANQSDYADNPFDFNSNYIAADATYGWKSFWFGGGYEFLGGDEGVGFSTPFATLHKFNGFADVFLATPGDGLRDLYGKAGINFGDIGPIKNVKFVAIWHDFNTDENDINIGDEFDFRLWGKWANIGLELKYGNFFTNETIGGLAAQDVERVFLSASYAF